MPQSGCHTTAGDRPRLELADIFHRYGAAYRDAHRLPWSHFKAMRAVEACRTAALGGHRESCAQCGFVRCAYNSCRNRHCPKCQSLAKAQWLEERRAELLPVGYFHNVFTLPHELNALILCREQNQRRLLNLLCQSAAQTLLQFGRNNLGGLLGVTMVLHTWDQRLRPHFHVHCLIPGGVLTPENAWKAARPRFLFSVRALGKVFRGKFLDGLQQLFDRDQLVFPGAVAHLAEAKTFNDLVQQLRRKNWIVYSKAPFAGPAKLLDYLGRYTQRIAISNHRLLSMDDGQVRFHYRDRRDGDQRKTAKLPAHEFIRRFLSHVLPSGFHRIRHYGLLANRHKQEHLQHCRQSLGAPAPATPEKKTIEQWLLQLMGIDITVCPQCGSRELQRTRLSKPPFIPAAIAGHSRDPPEART